MSVDRDELLQITAMIVAADLVGEHPDIRDNIILSETRLNNAMNQAEKIIEAVNSRTK